MPQAGLQLLDEAAEPPGLTEALELSLAQRAERGRSAIDKLNAAHDGMMDYILQNPGCTLRELSAHFGYSVAWCCRVTNSDIFQSRLAERRRDIEGLIAHDIPTQLKATAGLAIERITEKIAASEDPDFLLDAFDKVMHRAGYAPKANAPAVGTTVQNQQNNFFLSREDLARMRPNMQVALQEQPGQPPSSSPEPVLVAATPEEPADATPAVPST